MKILIKKLLTIIVTVSFFISIMSILRINLLLNTKIFNYISIVSSFLFSITLIYKYLEGNKQTKYTSSEDSCKNRNKKIAFIILLMNIVLVSVIRHKFFSTTFTTDHPMKYANYVEPAIFMNKNRDLFSYQKKYYLNDPDNLSGEKLSLNHLPIMEWLLCISYRISSFSTEFTTRFTMHCIFLMNIILTFLYLKEWVSDINSALISFFISINPTINFVHYVTVLDALLITFTFSSLLLLKKYFKSGKFLYLQLSGIIFGLGIITKSSIFLWTFPIFLVQCFFENKSNIKKLIADTLVFSFFSLIQLIPLVFVIYRYPYSSIFSNIVRTILWIFTNIILIKILNQKNIDYLRSIEFKKQWKTSLSIFFIFILFAFYFLVKNKIFNYSEDFLVDSDLIFYLPMYETIFKKLIVYTDSYFLFCLFLLQLIISIIRLIRKEYDKKDILIISISSAFFIYLILASKVIFIHNYYNAFLILTILINSLTIIYELFTKSFHIIKIILIIFMIIYTKESIKGIYSIMSFNQDKYREIQEFVKNRTSENYRCIYNINKYSYYAPIIDSGEINGNQILQANQFVQNIRNIGLKKSLKKYNINCFVQEKDLLNPKDFFEFQYRNKKINEPLNRDQIIMNEKSKEKQNDNYIENQDLIDANYDVILETNNFYIYELN